MTGYFTGTSDISPPLLTTTLCWRCGWRPRWSQKLCCQGKFNLAQLPQPPWSGVKGDKRNASSGNHHQMGPQVCGLRVPDEGFLISWIFISTVGGWLNQVCLRTKMKYWRLYKSTLRIHSYNLFYVSVGFAVSSFSEATSVVPPQGKSSFSLTSVIGFV